MSSGYLLDANALIALVVSDHEHHERAASWAAEVPKIAVCPIVEGALFRFLIRAGESANTASALLVAFQGSERFEFWPGSISYTAADMSHVSGHRQVTDAYLAALAAERGARLATFDGGLVSVLPDSTVLIP